MKKNPKVMNPKPARHDKPMLTLDRVLSRAGLASRTVAAEWIASGRVEVDGRVVTDPQRWVEPAREAVRLDGRRVEAARPRYYALHKPVGVLTSHGDPEGRPTIYDLLRELAPESAGWLFPVGRLDLDSSGLLLLTNDSLFAERIANPRDKVTKTYRVKIEGQLADERLEPLRRGLDIGRGERSEPARAFWLRGNGRYTWIEIEIAEGKNRQVRRMIEALGHRVLELTRIRIGGLELGGLPVGRLREIQPGEVLAPAPRAARKAASAAGTASKGTA